MMRVCRAELQRGHAMLFPIPPSPGGAGGRHSRQGVPRDRNTEMLKHVFDTEQGPLRISVSSVSVFSHMIKKPVHFAGNLHTGQGVSKHQSQGPCSKHICSSRGFRAILAKARWDIRDVRSRVPVRHQLSHKGFVAP